GGRGFVSRPRGPESARCSRNGTQSRRGRRVAGPKRAGPGAGHHGCAPAHVAGEGRAGDRRAKTAQMEAHRRLKANHDETTTRRPIMTKAKTMSIFTAGTLALAISSGALAFGHGMRGSGGCGAG